MLCQCVLHYMVRSKEAVGGVSREVVDILLHARLVKKSELCSEGYLGCAM